MFARISKALTSPLAGPAATAIAATLAILLGLTWASAAETKARLEGRIAELTAQRHGATVFLSAAPAPPRGVVAAAAERPLLAAGTPARAAEGKTPEQRLAEAPAGFDDCSRMQSADDAVLASLK